MRIGVVGPVGSDRFAENVGESLRQMGHVVTQLGPARANYRGRLTGSLAALATQASPRLDGHIQQQIVRSAQRDECEVVISVDARLMPDTVSGLKRSGGRVAFWFPDHVANLGRQLMLLAPYDVLFFKEPHVVERLRATLNIPVYYLPEACNPRWHRPLVAAGTDGHFVVAGNMYPSRVRLLERLIAEGVPLRLYGAGFPRWLGETPLRKVHVGRPIYSEEKARIFRSAVGVINTLHPGEVAGVNARLFEAAGCGAAVLTEFRPAVPELFSVGKEVLTFHDFDELVDQATRLLTERGLTGRIGDAATRRAHEDHSYDVRLAHILERLS